MADIFGYNRNARPEKVFTTENSTLTISGSGVGYMIQNWNISYQQQVQEIFELGSSNLYWLKGQPQGQGTIARIVGNDGGSGISLMPPGAFDLCDGGVTMNISASGGDCDGGGPAINIAMDGVVVTALGFSMSVQDMMVQQNFGWRFAKLSLT